MHAAPVTEAAHDPHTHTHTRNMTARPRFGITDAKLKTERQHERGKEEEEGQKSESGRE